MKLMTCKILSSTALTALKLFPTHGLQEDSRAKATKTLAKMDRMRYSARIPILIVGVDGVSRVVKA